MTDLRSKILAYVAEHPGCSTEQIVHEVRGKYSRIRKEIRELEAVCALSKTVGGPAHRREWRVGAVQATAYSAARAAVEAVEQLHSKRDFTGSVKDAGSVKSGLIDPDVRRLLDLCKRGPVPFSVVCDKLDLSPKRARQLIESSLASGHSFEVNHDHIGFQLAEPSNDVHDIVAPTIGERQIIGVMSDTHAGSKYALREQLRDFVHYAYSRGVRQIVHPGDALDGKYRHGIFELTHSGIEDQTRDLYETWPELPGLTYHCISGNHDDSFADDVGMAPGDYIEWYGKKHGRGDVKFYGRRGAYLKVHGAIVELWHPKKSGAYSLSYHIQNHIRDYGLGQKPDLLLCGHWHTFCYLEQRGVHALACGTFQGSGSAFSKSLGGAPSIGGTIISWELTEARTLRRVSVERSNYYESEEPRALECA